MAKNTKGFFKMEMLLLKIISEGDCYGYQIVQTLDKISNGTIHIAEGTISRKHSLINSANNSV